MAKRLPLQLWGGIECTINRVGNCFHNQLSKMELDDRLDIAERVATLGIQRIRYPVLWEHHCETTNQKPDCTRAKRQIDRLREFGIDPIVGLLHHGSGPRDTCLTDGDFAQAFADYAFSVAEQLPDVVYFTPVNEPLTTARFSGLYGHWYPHGRDDRAFLTSLINQVTATRVAMKAIRAVNANAKLVQTENLEQCHATTRLRYQAEFENQRRWFSVDLLMGKVDCQHPLWDYLEQHLEDLSALDALVQDPVTIDIMGWNYYLTSERFLDHRVERYPRNTHGGNGKDRYADVEAVRVMSGGMQGLEGLLHQAWNRFRCPMAVTEVHLGCHRESQAKWMLDAWQTANQVRDAGVDLRALTAWSLLGSYDWDSLCTQSRGHYESGAFDIRGGKLRPTMTAKVLQHLATGQTFSHPALQARGWWQHPSRFIFGQQDDANGVGNDENSEIANSTSTLCKATNEELERVTEAPGRPLLITGASGTLGRAFASICKLRRIEHRLLTRHELDITSSSSIDQALEKFQPWAIVNTAGYVRIDDAEKEPAECFKANTQGARLLAIAAAKHGLPLVTYSTDLVFDGAQQRPYVESHRPRALNTYGESKVRAERSVLAISPSSLVIRTSSFFGPWDDYNFLTTSLQDLEQGKAVYAMNDWIVSPTYVPDLVHTSLDLLFDGANGIWHLVNRAQVTWYDFLCEAASYFKLDTANVIGRRQAEWRFIAKRPVYSALTSCHGTLLPELSESLAAYCSRRVENTRRTTEDAL